jgi:hypothetical protein
MSTEAVIVTVVLDPYVGDRLATFAAGGPVWITSSAYNESTVREYWSAHPGGQRVTMWSKRRTGETEDEWRDILDDIELHYPHIARVEVVGASAAPPAVAAFRAFGYSIVQFGHQEFMATKNAPAA